MDESHDSATEMPSPAARSIAGWVEDNLGDVAEDATADIWREVDSYRSTALRDDVVEHVVQIFGVFSGTILSGRRPSVEDFGFTAEHASRRVESGINLEDFLRAFRIAQLALWRRISDHLSASGDPSRGTEIVGHLMRTIEAGSTAAAMTYLDAQQYSIADQERTARECIESLMSGASPSVPPLRAALRAAGLYEDSTFVVVVARGEAPSLGREMVTLGREVFASTLRGLIAYWHQQIVCLVPLTGGHPASLSPRLESISGVMRERGLIASIGVSAVTAGLAQTRDAVLEAETACAHLRGAAGVQLFSSLKPLDYLVVQADAASTRLISEPIRQFLLDDARQGSPLLATLQAYAQHDLNARQAATALHTHVNTVYYRLAQISDRTDLDVRRFENVAEVLLAARLLASAQ